jgi:hypothetical protein
MGIIRTILDGILRWIIKCHIERIVCLHFCRFKEGGSDLGYTHVHILSSNPSGATGVGHDDHTSPDDPKHNTISDAGGCTFKKKTEIQIVEQGAEESETIYSHNLGAKEFTTAYFHECADEGDCPRGYTRIRCHCRGKDGRIVQRCVCYTLDHDTFQRWYEERRWDNRIGEYRYPSLNVAGEVPQRIACGKTITLYRFTIEVVSDCSDYSGASASNNPLLRAIEQELRAAAGRIGCEGQCQPRHREIWRGWKCENLGGGIFHASAAMQWEIKCENS